MRTTVLPLTILCGLSLSASQQSLVQDGTVTGSISVPVVAPFTQMKSFRIEMRVHSININPAVTYDNIFALCTSVYGQCFGIELHAGSLWAASSEASTLVGVTGAQIAAHPDLVVRYQRDVTNGVVLSDFFDYQTGALIASGSSIMSTPLGQVNVSGSNGQFPRKTGNSADIAWVKVYSTLVPLGTGYPLQSQTADLADFRFEGNLSDSGSGHYGVSLSYGPSGGPQYIPTPVYAPGCNAGTSQSFRAGYPAQLDGTASVPGDDSGALSYSWMQIPTTLPDARWARMQPLRWRGRLTSTPTITGLVFGPANFQLTVTQANGQSATCVVHDGAVATDANGATEIDTGASALNSALNTLLNGSQIQYGKNPWPFYDQADMYEATARIAETDIGAEPVGTPPYYQPWWNTPALGTVSVTVGSHSITGSGTNFLSTVCLSDGVSNGAGAILTSSSTTMTIATGSVTFTTAANVAGTITSNNSVVYLFANGGNGWGGPYMQGTATSANGTTITVNVTHVFGSGTYSSWSVATTGYGWSSYLYVWYPTGRVINGVAETGRRAAVVTSCASDTQLTFSGPASGGVWATDVPSGSGYQYTTRAGVTTDWDYSTAPGNFYDNVQAFYELFYRSGIDTYLIAARKIADLYWTSPQVDRGYSYDIVYGGVGTVNQGECIGLCDSISGLVLRALDTGDGHADMWSGLHRIWQYSAYWLGNYWLNRVNFGNYNASTDPREVGYSIAHEAYCALFDPDTTADAPGGITYPQYCRNILYGALNGFLTRVRDPYQKAWLNIYIPGRSTFDTGKSWSGSTVTLTNGSTAVTCTGTNCGWVAQDFVTYSNAYPPFLFTGDGTAGTATAFPVSSASTDSVAYCTPNPCTFIDSNHFTLDRPYQGVTGTHGWMNTQSGVSPPYSVPENVVGFGEDSFMEGILGWGFYLDSLAMACTAPNTPAGCDSGTSSLAQSYSIDAATWLINYAYISSTGGMQYFAGYPQCVPASVTNASCTLNESSVAQREIFGDSSRGIMTAYSMTGNATVKSVMDKWYAGMWAKPGVGNPPVASPDGTYDLSFDASSCTVNTTHPIYTNCQSGYGYWIEDTPFGHKFFGQHFGISNQASWPVVRNGGPIPSSFATLYVSGRIADVPGSAQMQVTVTDPTGVTQAPVVCSSSPCAVRVNQTIGSPMIQVTYLSASGQVLSSGQPFTVTVN
jgi:hypothetical protein